MRLDVCKLNQLLRYLYDMWKLKLPVGHTIPRHLLLLSVEKQLEGKGLGCYDPGAATPLQADYNR